MKNSALVGILFMATSFSLAASTPQAHSLDDRGAMVMGFDQNKTTHHFRLYPDGGSIEVTVKDRQDTADLEAIRAHLPHISKMFAGGDFEAPMEVHAQHAPGTSELTKLKDRIVYRYVELPDGGRVDIVTTDVEAVKAVHEFLKFQIADHHTNDSTAGTKRPAITRP